MFTIWSVADYDFCDGRAYRLCVWPLSLIKSFATSQGIEGCGRPVARAYALRCSVTVRMSDMTGTTWFLKASGFYDSGDAVTFQWTKPAEIEGVLP